MTRQDRDATRTNQPLVFQHLEMGWWMLLAFLTWGIALEAMHGFKVDLYLNTERAVTRLWWTVAHAAGVILGITHIAWAFSLFLAPQWRGTTVAVGSACLKSAGIVLPASCFLLGWLAPHSNLVIGALLLPPGFLLLLIAFVLTARKIG